MIRLRKASERGHADYGWLDTRYTFSFSEYHDPKHMGFRTLRVMNEDRVAPGQGFGTHGHRDMEIITVVLEGALEHKDSLGNGSKILPGEVQCMTAGTGIQHSEFNPSQQQVVHLYQIWILPDRRGLKPSYSQKPFDLGDKRGELCLIASTDGRDGSLFIHQDASLYMSRMSEGQSLDYSLSGSRHAWVQVVRGEIELNDTAMDTGDGAALSEETKLHIHAVEDADVMVFDLG